MRRYALILAILLPSAGPAWAQYFFQDRNPADMNVQFLGAGFDLSLETARQGRFLDSSRIMEVQHWTGAGRRLSLYAERRRAAPAGKEEPDLEHLTHLYHLADREVPVEWGVERRDRHALGTSRYRPFAVHDGQCLVWNIRYELTDTPRPDASIVGFYCQASPVSRALADALVAATGHRDLHEPVAPAPGQFRRSRGANGQGPKAPPPPMPVQIRWEGRNDFISGTMYLSSSGATGRFRAQSGGYYCKGRLRAPEQSEEQPLGTWYLACSNGEAASGTFEGISNKGGTGWGADSEGNLVWIEYGAG